MGGVILVSEGVGCNFWPREGCKNEVPAMGTPLLPPVPMCDIGMHSVNFICDISHDEAAITISNMWCQTDKARCLTLPVEKNF